MRCRNAGAAQEDPEEDNVPEQQRRAAVPALSVWPPLWVPSKVTRSTKPSGPAVSAETRKQEAGGDLAHKLPGSWQAPAPRVGQPTPSLRPCASAPQGDTAWHLSVDKAAPGGRRALRPLKGGDGT